MIIYTTMVIFLKCPILIYFLFWNIKSKGRSHGKQKKNGNLKLKFLAEKRINTSLKDISGVLKNHGRHGLLSF